MKLVISLTLFLAALARINCQCSQTGNSIQCFDLKLESDKPFHFNESFHVRSTGNEYQHDLDTIQNAKITEASGSIGKQTFLMLAQLEELTIHLGNFERIEDGALCSIPKLRKLIIAGIKRPDLTHSVLSNCENLKSLEISAFELKVEPDAFKSMINLEQLNLAPIHIPHLTKEYFEPLENLESLKMYAAIDDADSGAICSPPKLEFLQIIRSNISQTVTKSILENCTHVKKLIIDRVNLNSGENAIEEGAFSAFTNTITVWFKRLTITHLTKKLLSGLENVESLVVYNSAVNEIDSDTFLGFNNLKDLFLVVNQLTHFDSNIIRPLPNLSRLDLTGNKLQSIDTITHPTLERLWVTKNSIKEADASAIRTNLPKLKQLIIRCNQLSEENSRALRAAIEDVHISAGTCDVI